MLSQYFYQPIILSFVESHQLMILVVLVLRDVKVIIMITTLKSTQLCRKFQPTALLNFACDG